MCIYLERATLEHRLGKRTRLLDQSGPELAEVDFRVVQALWLQAFVVMLLPGSGACKNSHVVRSQLFLVVQYLIVPLGQLHLAGHVVKRRLSVVPACP